MLQTMSSLFVRTLKEDPADAELHSHKLLVRAGYIRRSAQGVYTWLPLGLAVLRNIEAVVREEMNRVGAQEVLFSALQSAEPYQATGRWDDYGPDLFRLQDRRKGDYLLAPTHEEMFALLAKEVVTSYKDLPLTLYQIQGKFRDEARPRGGLLRGREFVMKDAYSFDLDEQELEGSYQKQRVAYKRIFDRLGLNYVIVSAMSGAMGGSKSEEFLLPSPVGEDTFAVSPGGYVANTEAVTTPEAPPVSAEGIPESQVVDTPDTPTIAAMIDILNREYPRDGRQWQETDLLKNVVVAAVDAEGNREVIVVGVPADRDVDLGRLEVALAPARVEVATSEDFENHPELVPGYIGPEVIGPNREGSEVRYLVDPRIGVGTAWATGANAADKHVINLVRGRDFEVDGYIEAAEVLEGDPAPDGSGPLTLEKGIEIGHIFQLGTKYAQALGLQVLDQNGKMRTVTMGSYGIGVSRILAAIVEETHDEHGLAWPVEVAPFAVQVVVAGKGEEVESTALELAEDFDAAGLNVLLDDRKGVSAGVKFADAELMGMPFTVVVGRGVANGVVELRERTSGTRVEVPVGEAVERLTALHTTMLEESYARSYQDEE